MFLRGSNEPLPIQSKFMTPLNMNGVGHNDVTCLDGCDGDETLAQMKY